MLKVDIVTPSRKLVESLSASSVKIPAHKGELEVMPGHAELLTLLDIGLLTVVTDGSERKFAVSYGFAEIRDNTVRIFAESVQEGREIDRSVAAQEQKNAQTALAGTLTREEFKVQETKLRQSIVRQQAAQ